MIYKYIDKWGLAILREKRIKITHPSAFNDPFEFLPRMLPSVTKAQVEAKLTDSAFLTNFFENHLNTGRVSSRAQFDDWLAQNRSVVADALYQAYTTNPYTAENFRETAGRRFGVTCFSEVPDSILMWSHYADKHQGMVIAFDEAAFGSVLYRVTYAADRQEYHPVFCAGSRTDFITEALRRKSPHWAYEREVRIVMPWTACDKDGDMHFCPVDPEDIREVYLGCKSPASMETDVRGLLLGSLAHVRLKKFRMHQEDFALECAALI